MSHKENVYQIILTLVCILSVVSAIGCLYIQQYLITVVLLVVGICLFMEAMEDGESTLH